MASPQKDRLLQEMKLQREKWGRRTDILEELELNPFDDAAVNMQVNTKNKKKKGVQEQAPLIDVAKSEPLEDVLLGAEVNDKQSWISFAPKTPFIATQPGQFFSSNNAEDWQFVNTELTPPEQAKIIDRINFALQSSYQDIAKQYGFNCKAIIGPNGQITFQFEHRDGSALTSVEERQLAKDIERDLPDLFNRHAASKDDSIKLRMMPALQAQDVRRTIIAPAPRPTPGYKSAEEIEEERRRLSYK